MESEYNRMVLKHETDLYHGNGKPGLTTRMALVEDYVDKIEESLREAARKTDRLSWIVAIGIGIVITLQVLLKR